MKLLQKLMDEGHELNMTGNAGTHYNGVIITEVYEEFVTIEPSNDAMRQAGQFRGGHTYVNIATITRLELAGAEGQVSDSLRRRLKYQ